MKTVIVENEGYNSIVNYAKKNYGMEIKKKVINCGMFIVPNQPATPNDIGWLGWFPKDWDKFKERYDGVLEKFGLKTEDCMVQIQAINSACADFSEYYDTYAKNILGITENPEYPERFTKEYYKLQEKLYFPNFLPLSILKNLEEGDTLVLTMYGNIEFHIKVEQTQHRYRRFGRFEECLRNLCGIRLNS